MTGRMVTSCYRDQADDFLPATDFVEHAAATRPHRPSGESFAR